MTRTRYIPPPEERDIHRQAYKAGTRPTPAARLDNPHGILTRTDLRELGRERRGIDAIFRALDPIVLDGYARPVVRVADYLGLLEERTFGGSKVR